MVESGDLRKKNTNELLRYTCYKQLALITELQTANKTGVQIKEKIESAVDKIDLLANKTDNIDDTAVLIKDALEAIKVILEP